jgi:long-subunit acyl-CoA synthetase (AMP-forming)
MAVLVRVFCAHHLPLQLPSKQFLQASSPCKQAVLADSDGWLHSGDVGELIPSGALKIIDRIKNIFKLAHGEYIAAEKLENQYKKCTLIDQIWVYGDSESSYLVAVVVPQASNLGAWARESGLPSDIQVCLDMHVQREQKETLA